MSVWISQQGGKVLVGVKKAMVKIHTNLYSVATVVKEIDEYDCKRLAYLLKHLNGLVDLPLSLNIYGLNVVKWCVDSAFSMVHDMKSHTISLRKVPIYSYPNKQELNRKILT